MDCNNRILISTDPQVYICGCNNEYYSEDDEYDEYSSEEEEYDEDDIDEMIIVYDDCILTTIAQIEKNIKNGVPIESIYIFINKENEDQEDIYFLIKNIYDKINFLLDDT